MRTLMGIVAFVVIVVGGLWVIDAMRSPLPDPPESIALRDIAECGHHWDSTRTLPLVRDIADVPEFHDCQRFVVMRNGAPAYDSLFAIFASPALGRLHRLLAQPAIEPLNTMPPPPDRVGSGGTGGSGAPAPVVSSLVRTPVVAVAVVFAENDYAPLRITSGLNCLYLWREIDTTLWRARMVSKDSLTAPCDENVQQEINPGPNLRVIRTTDPDFTQLTDYPDVARWDWDAVRKEQYVGIKCGNAWCEIGDSLLTPSPPIDRINGNEKRKRLMRIKGWYDQQYLAKMVNGRPVPSKILGTIVPTPDLDRMDDDSFRRPKHVASIILQDHGEEDPSVLQKYEERFNFKKTSPDRPMTLHLQHEGDAKARFWKGKVREAWKFWGGKDVNLKRRVLDQKFIDAGHKVPGVARWRWMDDDEGSWIRCSLGCCELSVY